MVEQGLPPLHGVDEDVALRRILEGTSTATGELFFQNLVENLAKALNVQGAWVTEYLEESEKCRALAFWMDGSWVEGYEYQIEGTPCERVIQEACPVQVRENVVALYPKDHDLKDFKAISYMGAPLLDIDGKVLGNLAAFDTRPLPEGSRFETLFRIFAARAASEHQRLHVETKLREREEKLGRLIDSAMDAIFELDDALNITMMNSAAENVLGCKAAQLVGHDFGNHLTSASRGKLAYLVETLKTRPRGQQYVWIPEGLTAVTPAGHSFPTEATVSRFEVQRKTYYTLILRDVNERLEAEEKIRSLRHETEYLKEEIKELSRFDQIIGQSPALLRALQDVRQVAETDATVLIQGETGTGKEVFARAIHQSSARAQMPLIKVNCAAIPTGLIESEFFGHEKGAFTGAVSKREGRFALAHGGTMFLDEIGDLPLDLQAKLLRVLQEGEFEPLGSSRTIKVDVRVLAATNRDLKKAVQDKTFREDLYYRLNVFPIDVPPLRHRGDDVILLASAFASSFSKKMGRPIAPLSPGSIRRLKAYDWPGNVRELQNVIERAVITSRDGQLNLARALPDASAAASEETSEAHHDLSAEILDAEGMRELERANIIRALEKSDWQVSGEKGAARLLGMNPSTLASRIKTLGIRRK